VGLDPRLSGALDLVSLRLFLEAVELGSLSRAAEASNIALAAVSRRLRLLEEYYGIALLERTGRGVAPTPAGKLLVERARGIFRQVDLARADLSDHAKGVRGSVGLLASPSALSQFLPGDLAKFARRYPDIRFDVREAYSAEIVAAVRNGTTDVGVIASDRETRGLTVHSYRRDRLVVVAPAGFRPGVARVRLTDLVDEDFVMMGDATAITHLVLSIATDQRLPLRFGIKVESFDAVCRMIQSGFGIGVLPENPAEVLAGVMGLRLLPLDEPWAERQMAICAAPSITPDTPAARLVDFLAAAAREDRG
jgi:DNA-binding transcriptional LysR family regulator